MDGAFHRWLPRLRPTCLADGVAQNSSTSPAGSGVRTTSRNVPRVMLSATTERSPFSFGVMAGSMPNPAPGSRASARTPA